MVFKENKILSRIVIFATVLFLAFFNSSIVLAQTERILGFHSDIVVHEDSMLTVKETIQVVANGQKIKRGIYRDFPTDYVDRLGNKVKVGFDIVDVNRNGIEEQFHTKRQSNGVRLYIGRKDYKLPKGNHVYAITYQTNQQVGFFENHDELYWNVTGNGWDFVIDKASAVIKLPVRGSDVYKQIDGWVGAQGQTAKLLTMRYDELNRPYFETTQSLSPNHGLTIAASWSKGIIKPLSPIKKMAFFFVANPMAWYWLLGLLAIGIYYIGVWLLVGKDPQKGTVIPRYEPPMDLSPAALGLIQDMAYSDHLFSSVIINLAVKKHIDIKDVKGSYTLTKLDGAQGNLSPEEKIVMKKLFPSFSTLKVSKGSYQKNLAKAQTAFKASLEYVYEKVFFRLNREYAVFGMILSAVVVFVVFNLCGSDMEAVVAGIVVGSFMMAFLPVLFKVFPMWLQLVRKNIWQSLAFTLGVFLLLLVAGNVMNKIGILQNPPQVFVLGLGVVTFYINILFYYLLKAPTLKGRKAQDLIEGFKMFLTVTEKERLNMLNPPDKTPELFEKYLPFALALGVDNKWSEQFSDVLKNSNYEPSWYAGRSFHSRGSQGWSTFPGDLQNSLSETISSASTPPASTSGFSSGGGFSGGGGGFSGGGGGGGGGGGW